VVEKYVVPMTKVPEKHVVLMTRVPFPLCCFHDESSHDESSESSESSVPAIKGRVTPEPVLPNPQPWVEVLLCSLLPRPRPRLHPTRPSPAFPEQEDPPTVFSDLSGAGAETVLSTAQTRDPFLNRFSHVSRLRVQGLGVKPFH